MTEKIKTIQEYVSKKYSKGDPATLIIHCTSIGALEFFGNVEYNCGSFYYEKGEMFFSSGFYDSREKVIEDIYKQIIIDKQNDLHI